MVYKRIKLFLLWVFKNAAAPISVLFVWKLLYFGEYHTHTHTQLKVDAFHSKAIRSVSIEKAPNHNP